MNSTVLMILGFISCPMNGASKGGPPDDVVFGTVQLNGRVARGFLVALENDTRDLLRNDGRQTSLLISSAVGLTGGFGGLGPVLGVSLLHPQKVDGLFIWWIENGRLVPEYIVVKKNQRILITDKAPGLTRVFQYSSLKQRMPAPFDPLGSRNQHFAFRRAEIGIAFYDVFHPSILGYVSVLDHPNYCFTDANGKFKISGNILGGDYNLWINHPRYGSWVRRVQFPWNQGLEIRLSSNDVDKTRSNIWSDVPPVP